MPGDLRFVQVSNLLDGISLFLAQKVLLRNIAICHIANFMYTYQYMMVLGEHCHLLWICLCTLYVYIRMPAMIEIFLGEGLTDDEVGIEQSYIDQ